MIKIIRVQGLLRFLLSHRRQKSDVWVYLYSRLGRLWIGCWPLIDLCPCGWDKFWASEQSTLKWAPPTQCPSSLCLSLGWWIN